MSPSRLQVAGALLALGWLLAPGRPSAQAQPDEGSAPQPGSSLPAAPACLSSVEQVADSISFCMRTVMYPRDLNEVGKPEVAAAAAALLCRGARTREAGRGLSDCVQRVMYERSGLGARREGVSSDAAAVACRHATSETSARVVEDCMRGLLYERSGLGARREDMSAMAAASACQSTVAPAPLPAWLVQPCHPPEGTTASALVEECVRRLLYRREGLGERREQVSAEVAVFACQGALVATP